jgi:hypothetical protein
MTERSASTERQEAETVAPEARAGLPDVIYLPDQSQPAPKQKRAAPWRGRPRVADPHSAFMPPWRATPGLSEKVLADAAAAGLSYGAFMRKTFGGSPGPRAARHVPPPDNPVLTKLLAELGKIGSNHNQLARAFNRTYATPGLAEWQRIEADIQAMRSELVKALGHGD